MRFMQLAPQIMFVRYTTPTALLLIRRKHRRLGSCGRLEALVLALNQLLICYVLLAQLSVFIPEFSQLIR